MDILGAQEEPSVEKLSEGRLERLEIAIISQMIPSTVPDAFAGQNASKESLGLQTQIVLELLVYLFFF